MEKEIMELREGYYYFQLLINNPTMAFNQVKYVFKYTFIGFYIALLELIFGLYFEENFYTFPDFFKNNIIIRAILSSLLLFGSYKLIIDPIFKNALQKELNINLEPEKRKPRIIKFLLYFFMSIASMFLVMALFVYKII